MDVRVGINNGEISASVPSTEEIAGEIESAVIAARIASGNKADASVDQESIIVAAVGEREAVEVEVFGKTVTATLTPCIRVTAGLDGAYDVDAEIEQHTINGAIPDGYLIEAEVGEIHLWHWVELSHEGSATIKTARKIFATKVVWVDAGQVEDTVTVGIGGKMFAVPVLNTPANSVEIMTLQTRKTIIGRAVGRVIVRYAETVALRAARKIIARRVRTEELVARTPIPLRTRRKLIARRVIKSELASHGTAAMKFARTIFASRVLPSINTFADTVLPLRTRKVIYAARCVPVYVNASMNITLQTRYKGITGIAIPQPGSSHAEITLRTRGKALAESRNSAQLACSSAEPLRTRGKHFAEPYYPWHDPYIDAEGYLVITHAYSASSADDMLTIL